MVAQQVSHWAAAATSRGDRSQPPGDGDGVFAALDAADLGLVIADQAAQLFLRSGRRPGGSRGVASSLLSTSEQHISLGRGCVTVIVQATIPP